MITVACVWVQANVPYTLSYIEHLRAMVAKNLSFDHEFVCLTDQPKVVSPHVDRVLEVPRPTIPGWWSKMHLFDQRNGFRDRVMYLDLDTLVINTLDAVAGYPASFALIPHEGSFQGRDGLKVIHKYNSSVMVWDNTPRMHQLYKDWVMSNAPRVLWGDQDFIASQMPDEAMMPLYWFPRLSSLVGQERVIVHKLEPAIPHGATVILCKKPKNHDAAKRYPWFRKIWED